MFSGLNCINKLTFYLFEVKLNVICSRKYGQPCTGYTFICSFIPVIADDLFKIPEKFPYPTGSGFKASYRDIGLNESSGFARYEPEQHIKNNNGPSKDIQIWNNLFYLGMESTEAKKDDMTEVILKDTPVPERQLGESGCSC